jgi:hypothetical protein
MTDVACFCGCLFSFEGAAAACPSCDEVARVAPGPMLASDGYRWLDEAAAGLEVADAAEDGGGGAGPEAAIALAALLR